MANLVFLPDIYKTKDQLAIDCYITKQVASLWWLLWLFLDASHKPVSIKIQQKCKTVYEHLQVFFTYKPLSVTAMVLTEG